MKEYAAYMDAIAVDAALREKILENASNYAGPHRRRVPLSVAAAVCAAATALFVWGISTNTVPQIVPNPAPSAPITRSALPTPPLAAPAPSQTAPTPPQTAPTSSQTAPTSPPTVPTPPLAAPTPPLAAPAPPPTDTSAPSSTREPLLPLVFNRADRQLSALLRIPGHFWYALTDAQRGAVLPEFPFPIAATAHYSGDGALHHITAYEMAADGEVAVFDKYHTRMEITLAPGAIPQDVLYDYTPETSDVCGITISAGIFDHNTEDGTALYCADFEMEGVAYSVKLYDSDAGDAGKGRLTEIVNAIVRHGAPDLRILGNPVIPALRDEEVTLEDAYADPDFGAYIPREPPSGYVLESARRFLNQESDSLYVSWSAGYDYLTWSASAPTQYELDNIVGPEEREKYDLSLYPIPRADSVPEELRQVVDNPVFRSEEVTPDMIRARAYHLADRGDTPGWHMHFGVLCGDVVVQVSAKGLSPDRVYDMLTEITSALNE